MSRSLAILVLIFGLLTAGPMRAQEPALELGRAAFEAKMRGQFALAIGLFDRALLQSNLSAAQQGMLYYGRGASYEQLEVRGRALSDLDTPIVLLPEFPNSYIYRALIWVAERQYDQAIEDELSLKVGDGGNRKGGISWGCLTPPLLHRRSDMPCPKITSSS